MIVVLAWLIVLSPFIVPLVFIVRCLFDLASEEYYRMFPPKSPNYGGDKWYGDFS